MRPCILLRPPPSAQLTHPFRAEATDRRVTLIGELVSSIRVVKMFAWEKTSVGRISAAREKELNGIKKRAKVRVRVLYHELSIES